MSFSMKSNAINEWIAQTRKRFNAALEKLREKRKRGESELEPEIQTTPQEYNRRTLAILAFVVVLVGGIYIEGVRPPAFFDEDKYVTVEEGASLTTIAETLEQEGVVRSAWWLKLFVRISGRQSEVQAGDYLFAKPVSTLAVARRISTGAFGLEPIKVTIPEGASVPDMAIIFEKRLFKFDPQAFLEEAVALEGYLYPDTYHFLPNATQDEVIRAMRDNFDQRIVEFAEELAQSEFTLHEILTLASIIEKEAFNDTDRQLISGVLHNRLEMGMRLQVDATFVYTHGKGTYQITLAELKDDSNLYNTYVHEGLPPGPIASIGRSSIYAALNPTPNDYIFYLADRKGTTYFSVTYEEHLRKKRIYVD